MTAITLPADLAAAIAHALNDTATQLDLLELAIRQDGGNPGNLHERSGRAKTLADRLNYLIGEASPTDRTA